MPPFSHPPIPKESDHSQLFDLIQQSALITIIIGIIVILLLKYPSLKLSFKNKIQNKYKNIKPLKYGKRQHRK